ncbi:MAG: CsiV family protein [Pseudohongiellaceae bacterium]
MKYRHQLTALLLFTLAAAAPAAVAQVDPWYQVEVTIFAHEATDLTQERWELQTERALAGGLGTRGQMRLGSLLDFLDLEDWSALDPGATTRAANQARDPAPIDRDAGVDPEPAAPLIEPQAFEPAAIKLPDHARDAFLRLPDSEQNFRQTNQALERSPDYRVLWHAAWRQPMVQADATPYMQVEGGRDMEMNGTLRAYFSPDTTRVILDAELWRTTAVGGEMMRLPLQQTRPMVSNDFHYLDHPALGILVEVFRYERPVALDNELPGNG